VGDADEIGIEVNIRRVCERVAGRRLSEREAEHQSRAIALPLNGRDRLLALMDLGATVCTARTPACASCPVAHRCATRGTLRDEKRSRQAPYEGSFRQRRGRVLAALRDADEVATAALDGEALASLVRDGLAEVTDDAARLPGTPARTGG
jgi:A/G-specific adenine glycosylase